MESFSPSGRCRDKQIPTTMIKRRADVGEERKSKKLRVQPTDSINLTYPFWYTAEDNAEIVPPFIDPTGPLYDQDGKLNIRLSTPIALVNNGVGLKYGPSLGLNNNQLVVRVDPVSPLDSTPDGLSVRVDDETITVNDNWELAVQFSENQPFSYTANGIMLNVDDTLLIAPSDTDPMIYEIGVHLNNDGPITADENGIDLEYNHQTLSVTSNEQGQGVLDVNLKSNGGLGVGENGIGINYDGKTLQLNEGNNLAVRFAVNQPFSATADGITLNIDPSSLQINNNTLSAITSGLGVDVDTNTLQVSTVNNRETLKVKLAPSNPIGADSSGIKLLYNSSDFFDAVQTGLSTTTPISYLSPYCIYEAGNSSLNEYSQIARSVGGVNWPIAAYVKVANCSGVCNGVLNFILNRNQISAIGSNNTSSTNVIKFCMVINPSGSNDGSHSSFQNPTFYPNVSETAGFMAPVSSPAPFQTIPPYSNNWFVAKWIGVRVKFYAADTQSEAVDSYAHYYPANIQNSGAAPVIFFVFEIQLPSGQNWYNGGNPLERYRILNSGSIPFQYLAQRPTYTASQ